MSIVHRRSVHAAIIAAVLAALVVGPSALAAPGGNNGTVKIQEGATNAEPITRNEPHVCTFHVLFQFADPFQEGSWSIDQQAPTGSDPSVLSGTYAADANGMFATVEFGLPIGHYTLNWDGRSDQNIKHKTFWVTCENPAGPINPGGGIGVG